MVVHDVIIVQELRANIATIIRNTASAYALTVDNESATGHGIDLSGLSAAGQLQINFADDSSAAPATSTTNADYGIRVALNGTEVIIPAYDS